jgi:hypothetical protein
MRRFNTFGKIFLRQEMAPFSPSSIALGDLYSQVLRRESSGLEDEVSEILAIYAANPDC